MLEDFDKLVRQRSELMDWWKLGQTIAKYDGKYHVLRVDLQNPSLVAFCGQQYAGAKNYHDAPKSFFTAIRLECDKQINQIVKKAYENEIAILNAAIEKMKTEVLEQLEVSNSTS
jgi:hypothetical protein